MNSPTVGLAQLDDNGTPMMKLTADRFFKSASVAADVVSARITPAEANARAAETRKVLKAVEQMLKSARR
jgi:hypothetical protein